MKAVTFDGAIPRYLLSKAAGAISQSWMTGRGRCTHLQEVEPPELPGPEWIRVRTRLGGICGSDLNLIGLGVSPSTSPFSSFPFVIGHENVGEVDAVGPDAGDLKAGDRVVVNPLLACLSRGIDPPCPACASGHFSRCERFTDGRLAPGIMMGSTRGIGGSWGEYYVAHRGQVHRVPDGLSDRAAVLTEPLAAAVSPVMADPPRAGESVLVLGGGTVGLMVTAALSRLAPDCRITVLARHGFQAEAARRLGATRAVQPQPGEDYVQTLSEIGGARLHRPILGERIAVGGFDRSFVCVGGTSAMTDALRFTRSGGEVVLLGNVAKLDGVDWTPVWISELRLRGSLCYDRHPWPAGAEEHSHPAATRDAFALALELLAQESGAEIANLLTHVYPLADYRQALALCTRRGREPSIKIALSFGV
jgi:threonine dehydrogenase-like Zn-dependent dehydrogenase